MQGMWDANNSTYTNRQGDIMPTYEVKATTKIKSKGIFETDTPEEAIELFRLEEIKIDYSGSSLGYMASGWNPVAKEITNADI